MQLIDFHSHILPGIDDGSRDIEETRKLLLEEKHQGVVVAVATPHCYENKIISEFIEERDRAYALVQQYFGAGLPHVVPGAEVALHLEMSKREGLDKLCIGNTRYMLVEMPFCYWNEWHYQELEHLKYGLQIEPIIAHLDRYLGDVREINNIEKLFEGNFIIQINAESLLYFSFRRIFKRLVKRDVPMILGSDCHDPVRRPSYMARAAKYIQKRYGATYLEEMMQRSKAILQNQMFD